MTVERDNVRVVLRESHSPDGNGIRREDGRSGCGRSTGSLGLESLKFQVLLLEE